MIGTRFTSVESTRYVGRTRPYAEHVFDPEVMEFHRCGVRINRPRSGQRLGVCRDCYETDTVYLSTALGWKHTPPRNKGELSEKCKRGHHLAGANRGKSGCVVCDRARTHLKRHTGVNVKDIPKVKRERMFAEAIDAVLASTHPSRVQLAKDALGVSA